MKLPPEWSELIDSLLSHRVRFLIFVERTAANARKLGDALAEFGYPALAKEWRRFTEPDRMATLGREPLRIDIMTSISGVAFAPAWNRRLRVRHGRRVVGFLGRRDLIRNKRASGRTKDLLDIALLEETED
jgi:hypothetical protein